MLKGFKEFAMRGNVLDMAVGVIIGAAFGKIVNSFVADIHLRPHCSIHFERKSKGETVWLKVSK